MPGTVSREADPLPVKGENCGMRKKKKWLALTSAFLITMTLFSCGKASFGSSDSSGILNEGESGGEKETSLVYGSGDYTRINPALDEHGEINILIFDGLTAHDGDNQVIPALAKSWEYDPQTFTYTFHLRENVLWHDGEPFTAEDVKFTIESIMDPANESENASNY